MVQEEKIEEKATGKTDFQRAWGREKKRHRRSASIVPSTTSAKKGDIVGSARKGRGSEELLFRLKISWERKSYSKLYWP